MSKKGHMSEDWIPGWLEFRESYPRREAWGRAEKAYKALWKAGKLPAREIMSVAIRCQQRPGGCLEVAFSESGRDLRPLPASWLNAERWHDEAPPGLLEKPASGLTGTRRVPNEITEQEKAELDPRQEFFARFRK